MRAEWSTGTHTPPHSFEGTVVPSHLQTDKGAHGHDAGGWVGVECISGTVAVQAGPRSDGCSVWGHSHAVASTPLAHKGVGKVVAAAIGGPEPPLAGLGRAHRRLRGRGGGEQGPQRRHAGRHAGNQAGPEQSCFQSPQFGLLTSIVPASTRRRYSSNGTHVGVVVFMMPLGGWDTRPAMPTTTSWCRQGSRVGKRAIVGSTATPGLSRFSTRKL